MPVQFDGVTREPRPAGALLLSVNGQRAGLVTRENLAFIERLEKPLASAFSLKGETLTLTLPAASDAFWLTSRQRSGGVTRFFSGEMKRLTCWPKTTQRSLLTPSAAFFGFSGSQPAAFMRLPPPLQENFGSAKEARIKQLIRGFTIRSLAG